MQLSRNEKILAIAFAVMSICGILFTPVGLETRPLSALRSYALIPLFLSGTILDLASTLSQRDHSGPCISHSDIQETPNCGNNRNLRSHRIRIPRPGDQAQFFFVGVAVPVGITINEVVVLIASIVVLLIAPMVYLANRKSSKPLPLCANLLLGSVEYLAV